MNRDPAPLKLGACCIGASYHRGCRRGMKLDEYGSIRSLPARGLDLRIVCRQTGRRRLVLLPHGEELCRNLSETAFLRGS